MAHSVSKPQHLIIGLTGGIGCGKSQVAQGLVERGAFLVDTDQLAHQLTAPGGAAMPAIELVFGQDFVTPEGALDRAAMRQLIFNDSSAKSRLEAIVHPLIRAKVHEVCSIAPASAPYLVVDIPLLLETGREHYPCQRILVVDCPVSIQIKRVMARNQLSASAVQAIIDHQCSRAQRLAAADDIIDNSGPLSALPTQLDALHTRYCALATQAN